MVKIKHFIVLSFVLLTGEYKYKNLPGHLSWEAMQRLAASGSYIVVSDYRLLNCGALLAAFKPYFNRLSAHFP